MHDFGRQWSRGRSRLAIRILVFYVLVAALVHRVVVDAADTNVSPIPPTFFGMHIKVSTGQKLLPISFGAFGKGAGLTWAYFEPACGVFHWDGIDRYLAAAESQQADFFYAFKNTPQWASSKPTEFCYKGNFGCAARPARIEYWNEFVTALVTCYKGRIKFYEIWDEANASPSWSVTYEDLVLLAKNAHIIIKSIDPDAVVLTPATVGGIGYRPRGDSSSGIDAVWMEQYLKAGGNRYADGGNCHGYLMRTVDSPYRMPEDDVSPCHVESWNYVKSCSGSISDSNRRHAWGVIAMAWKASRSLTAKAVGVTARW